ncbi:MAG: hypothetical protein EA384_05440 [Spirochaetaceae bacterium]|nr:MAG: hypothetical protein EA384_05440 [Spirochaetaceae bacterium]
MKMPLWTRDYKRLVSREACQVEKKKAIRELLEQTLKDALNERMQLVRAPEVPRAAVVTAIMSLSSREIPDYVERRPRCN